MPHQAFSHLPSRCFGPDPGLPASHFLQEPGGANGKAAQGEGLGLGSALESIPEEGLEGSLI